MLPNISKHSRWNTDQLWKRSTYKTHQQPKDGCKHGVSGTGNLAAGGAPAVAPLSYLLGTWRGQGEGGYPSIHSFSYAEELHFSHSPNKPVIGYTQKTWKLISGEPMHAESGYWRPKPDGTIEVVIAQSTGLVEVQKGTYSAEDRVIQLQSEIVGNASKVKEIRRHFQLVDEILSYEVQMATNTITLQPHLKATLRKL